VPTADGNYVTPHPATIGFTLKDDVRIQLEGSAAGWVIRQCKPLLIPDVRQTNDYYELMPDTRSQLCVR